MRECLEWGAALKNLTMSASGLGGHTDLFERSNGPIRCLTLLKMCSRHTNANQKLNELSHESKPDLRFVNDGFSASLASG